jgi:hypothetical protein
MVHRNFLMNKIHIFCNLAHPYYNRDDETNFAFFFFFVAVISCTLHALLIHTHTIARVDDLPELIVRVIF